MMKTTFLVRAGVALARTASVKALAIAAVLAMMVPTTAAGDSNVEFYYLDGEWCIMSQQGWEEFCENVNTGKHDGFCGALVKLYEDLTITTMVGSSSDNCFKGTFDGQGHTVTVKYGSEQEPLTEENAALFRYTGDDAAFKNLHVTGSIYTNAKYAAGLIAQGGGNSIVVSNCLSSVTINSGVDGDGTHAGFVAVSNVGTSMCFEGCRFDGSLLGTKTTCCGGFVGWRANGSVGFYGCVFSPRKVTVGSSGSTTFCRNLRTTDPVVCSIANTMFGDDQSSQDRTIAEGMNVIVSLGGDATYCNLTGITLYESAESFLGMKYGGTCFYNSLSGDIEVNLGLDVAAGQMLKKYNVVNGKLYRSGNPFTLAPTADEVVISAETQSSPWTGNGTDDNPCVIATEQDLKVLSENVNNGNSYECVLFRQSADIALNEFLTPIGSADHAFMGRYDGNGKKISNLNIVAKSGYAGLFGKIEGRYESTEKHHYHAQIYGLTIENADILFYDGSYAGVVVAYVGKCGQILNCNVINGEVESGKSGTYGEGMGVIGGLAGFAEGQDGGYIQGNRVVGTYVHYGAVCGGLLGEAQFPYTICDNFVDANVHSGLTYNNDYTQKWYREAAFIGSFDFMTDTSFKDNNNYYHSSKNLPMALEEAYPDLATPVYIVKDVSADMEVSGTPTITYNGKNYYAAGTEVTLSVASQSIINIDGAAAYTISDDLHSATITFGDSDITFDVLVTNGICGENATWVLDKDEQGKYTRLTISGSGDMYNYEYTTVNSLWRTTAPWGWDLTSITIGNEITSIGDFAFIGCQQLGKLSLGNSVTSIGTNAFDHCDGLTRVSLPYSVSTLAAGAFKNCVNLQNVNIQKSDALVSLTGGSAFDGCHSSLVIVVPIPALAVQYKTADYWSSYAAMLRVDFGNRLFTATDEGGTAAYAITSGDDLRNLSAAINTNQGHISVGKIFRQTADIVLSGEFPTIANYPGYNFSGTYDGGGHSISGLSINGNETYNGLFGLVSGGTVKNVALMNPSVSATGSYTGALIGRIETQGSALNCYAYGTDNLIGFSDNATVANVGRVRKVELNDGITTTPDARDINSGGGFVYQGDSYLREGLELTINAPEGYDAVFSYTKEGTTTQLEGSTLTVPDTDISLSITQISIKKWGGSGTSDDPFIIEYVSQLDSLAERVNSGSDFSGTYFQLGRDICYDTKTLSQGENFTPIGGHKKYFRGHFDGAMYKISGIRLYKDGTDFEDFYQGIFGQIGAGASVSGIILSDAHITGYQRIGGIVGENQGGTVSNCHVLSSDTIHAVKNMSTYHGGIVGANSQGGIVTNCTSAATVTCADDLSFCQYYGGIVGLNQDATVTNCLYTGTTVIGNACMGAIIGLNSGSNSKVEDCYYTAEDVTGGDGDTNCAIGELSDGTADPEHVMHIDFEPAPEAIATRLAPLDNEDNNFFVALMARRAATLKAAVPQYDASVNLTLRGRTFNRDGKWRTVCLPFDVVLKGSPLEGAEARELTNASITGTTLNLEFSNPVEQLVAGTPYIIRMSSTESEARAEASAAAVLSNPKFAKVDIDDTDRSFDNAESGSQRIRFVGSYKMQTFADAQRSTLLMNGADRPSHPAVGTSLGAFRAYFMIGNGEGTTTIDSFNIKLGDDDYTGIAPIAVSNQSTSHQTYRKVVTKHGVQIIDNDTHVWYDLNGRKQVKN